jgi:ribonuclease HI
MDFDGAVSKEGVGDEVWLNNHKSRYSKIHSYKLNFQCTNNIVEYEALMLILKLLKKVGAKNIMVRGDFELVIKQIKGDYSTKNPRLRAYINVVVDFLECFTEINLKVMPRGQNILADGFATSESTCKIRFKPNIQYTVEVKCQPTAPDNNKYWQVFGNDDQIEDFLLCRNDFKCTNIDVENDDDNVNKLVFDNDSVNKVDLDEVNKNDKDSNVLHLKNNIFPRGLVSLEDLFDFNDVAKSPKLKLVVRRSKSVT